MKRFSTTNDFINNHVRSGGFPAGEVVEMLGYNSAGDQGAALWRSTGLTIASSQTVIDTNDIKISDASGNEFELVHIGIIDLNALGGTSGAYVTIATNAGLTWSQSFTSIPSNATLNYDTTSDMVNAAGLAAGDVVETEERSTGNGGGGVYDVVLTSSVTPNGYDIIQSVADASISFVLRTNGIIDIRQIGAVPGTVTDVLAVIQHANDNMTGLITGRNLTYAIQGTVRLSSFKKLFDLKLHLLGDQSDYNIAAVINDDIAGTGNLGIGIENVEVIGFNTTQQSESTVITPANGGVGGIYLEKVANTTVRGCITSDTWSGITISQTHSSLTIKEANNKILYNRVTRAHSYASTGNSGTPRGIFCNTNGVIHGNYTDDCATGYYISSTQGCMITSNVANAWHKDDGYYLLGNYLSVIGNQALGNGLGSGFAIAYNEDSIITGNYASNCSNMGFRIHCPQRDTIITSNKAELCGYGFRIENSLLLSASSLTRSGSTATFTTSSVHILETGDFVVVAGADQPEYNGIFRVSRLSDTQFSYTVSGTPVTPATGTINAEYTCIGITLSNNQAKDNDLSGIQVSFLINSIIKNNICEANNQQGVTVSTRGGLSMFEYCQDNIVKDNKAYDYQGVPTQTFGFYNYDASSSGANTENTGNVIAHKSETGIDYFGANETDNAREECEVGSFLPNLIASGGGSTTYTKQEGRYRRDGNVVTVFVAIQIGTPSGLSGTIQIDNMPFTASAGITQQTGTMHTHSVTYPALRDNLHPVIATNTNILNFVASGSGVNTANLDASGINASSELYLTISYWIKN